MISREFLLRQNNTFTAKQKFTIIEFFITFSRIEFALIVTGKMRDIPYAMADWKKFADEIKEKHENTLKNEELQQAIDYILGNPPRYLANDELGINWRDRDFIDGTSEITKLCESIKIVRNNFFHGSKFNFVVHNDRGRDFKLIESSLVILNHLLNLDDLVKEKFLEPIM